MNSYESYKETDIPWLGEIPSHWEISNISHIFEERKEKNIDKKENFILSVIKNIGVVPYSQKGNVGNKASEDVSNYKIVYPNDIVLNSMNMMIGSLGKSEYKGILSQVYYVLTVKNDKKEKYDINYLTYIFKNQKFFKSLKVLGKGILEHRLRVPMELLKYETFPIPPISEQIQIANYLDWKINEIDKLISIEKEQIKELENLFETKLKNLYLEIKIYNLVPLKRICKIYSGQEVIDEIEYQKEAIPVYGSGKEVFKYTSKNLLKGKFIIFGRKGTIGKPYILDKEFWLVDTAYAAQNNNLVTFDYLFYLLRIFEWKNFTTNTVKPSIVANQMIQSKIKLPSLDIQNLITNKIKKIEIENNNIIENITKSINYLQALKQSLIAEVVTGKIDIRNITIPQYEKVETILETDDIDGLEVQDYGD